MAATAFSSAITHELSSVDICCGSRGLMSGLVHVAEEVIAIALNKELDHQNNKPGLPNRPWRKGLCLGFATAP